MGPGSRLGRQGLVSILFCFSDISGGDSDLHEVIEALLNAHLEVVDLKALANADLSALDS